MSKYFSLHAIIVLYLLHFITTRVYYYLLGSLSNHDDDGNKNPTNLHIWQWKTVFLHALHVHFSCFDILKTFSFFLQREMTCFSVVWTTWAYVDSCSILSSYVPSAGSKSIPEQLEDIFQAKWLRIIEKWKAKLHFQMTFSLPSTSCLLKLPTILSYRRQR